jgi:hypothetical protein
MARFILSADSIERLLRSGFKSLKSIFCTYTAGSDQCFATLKGDIFLCFSIDKAVG